MAPPKKTPKRIAKTPPPAAPVEQPAETSDLHDAEPMLSQIDSRPRQTDAHRQRLDAGKNRPPPAA